MVKKMVVSVDIERAVEVETALINADIHQQKRIENRS
jgi:hypothetical protein